MRKIKATNLLRSSEMRKNNKQNIFVRLLRKLKGSTRPYIELT